jgi:hypothetical protein
MENAQVYLASLLSGLKFLCRRSGWVWMLETKTENDFTWREIIGIVLLSDYRRHIHFNEYDNY